MKLEKFKQLLIYETYLKKWVRPNSTDKILCGTWSWNEDGSVDVYGDVYLPLDSDSMFLKLPFKFGKVTGTFKVNDNELTTLENCPDEVGETFLCSRNNLKSLEYAPKKVGETFYCTKNRAGNFTQKEVRKYCDVADVRVGNLD